MTTMMTNTAGARENALVLAASFIVAALVMASVFPHFELGMVLDVVAYAATNEVVSPLFWGFVVLASIAVILDW